MTLPLPVWCFLDGPLKGKSAPCRGRLVIQHVQQFWWSPVTAITYKPVHWFKGDKGQLTVVAQMLHQQRAKWKRIQCKPKKP